MRPRPRVLRAEVALLLALGLVIGAFGVAWHPTPPSEPVRTVSPTLAIDVVEIIPTRLVTSLPSPSPSLAPPMERLGDEVVIEEVITAMPLPPVDDAVIRPLALPDPPVQLPPVIEDYPDVEESILPVAEIMPELIGGTAALQERLTYPRFCREAGIEGRVLVQFVVGTDGSVTDAVISRGIGGGCDEAALEAVKSAQFTPGRQRGRPVRVRFALPVTFRLH